MKRAKKQKCQLKEKITFEKEPVFTSRRILVIKKQKNAFITRRERIFGILTLLRET